MLKFDRTLRTLLPLLVGFAALFANAGLAIWLSTQQQATASWVRHALEVENRLGRVQQLATDAETGQRGFLLTGKDSYLEPLEAARRQIMTEIDALASQTADNEVQRRSIIPLREAIGSKLATIDSSLKLRAEGHPEQALALVNTGAGREQMMRIRDLIAGMRGEEDRLLRERSESAERIGRYVQIALTTSAALVIVLAFVALRDGRRRLLRLQASNQRLTEEITERTAAESKVRQLQKMEAVGQLTGGIAHDFNNMLAIVLGSLDMGRRRLTGAEDPRVLTSIENATEGAQRAAVLTARLLAFSRQQPLDPAVVDANKLVGGMSELLRRTIGESVRIETVLAGGLWRTHADAAQLENALVNLAVNGRDAMPDGGQLTIETANTDLDDRYAQAHSEVTAGQYVMISVTDTGVGMGPEVIERAFDPFYTTKGAGKGTGLGLSQVFGFVKQSGGHVKIYSEIGQGSTIKVYLRRYTGTEAAAVDATNIGALSGGSAGEIVLVVDNEVQVRLTTVDLLRELGYTTIHAAGPHEGLQQLQLHPAVPLMLTDIVMPEMNGRQLANKALSLRPHLKVLYMTGYTRNAVVHNGVVDPGTAFLPKPFTLEQLATKVRQVLGRTEQAR